MRTIAMMVFSMVLSAGCGSSSGTPASDMLTTKDMAASPGNGGRTGCKDAFFACSIVCQDQACVDACKATITTANGMSLYDAVLTCGNTACPPTNNGPCTNPTSLACNNCWSTALNSGGACASEATACRQDQ